MTTCQVCGGEVNDDDFIVLEGRRVCPACKPMVVQQLKEGCLPPMPTSPPIELSDHEFGFEELLKKTWSICQLDWPVLLGLQLLGVIPLKLIKVFLYPGAGLNLRSVPLNLRLIHLCGAMVEVVVPVAIVWVVNERVTGRSLSFAAALGKAVPRWLPAIGTNLLMILAVAFFSLLLVVPGIIAVGFYMFAIQAAALRGCVGFGALDYSKRLVEGRWWRIVGKWLGLSLPSLISIFFLRIVTPHLPQNVYVAIPRDLALDVVAVYFQVGTTLLFLNLDAIARKTRLTEVAPGSGGAR